VRITAYAVSGAWSLAILIAGLQVPGGLMKALSILPIVILGAFALFDHWLWAKGPLPRLIHTPDLRGTWRGTLNSIRDDGTGQVIAHEPIPIFLVIDQSYLTLDICLMSAESSSRSFATTLQRNSGESYTVFYHYGNKPKITLRKRSPIHDGASRLEVSGTEPAALSGEYWTDRETHGSYDVERIASHRFYRWEDAIKANGSKG
jgi:SMODS-associating 2TM, beta-strand rich effector domain